MALAAAPLTCNQSCEILVPKDGAVDAEFLYYLLHYGLSAFIRLSGGTTFGAITRRDLARVRFAVPSQIEEQAAIARILDAVDTALECTRAAVENARLLRDSLIHELLTRGLGMERSKKSPAGLVPTSWGCDLLGQHIADGPTNGVYRPESDYAAQGTPIVRIDDFAEGQIHDFAALRRVTVEAIIQTRFSLVEGDVLINRVNSLSHIGKSALVPPIDEPTIFESNMMRLRCGPRILPAFLIIVLCSDIARRHWLARAKSAVNQASVNQRDVRELPVPIPNRDEQNEIARIIAASTDRISLLGAVSDAQQALKIALMHDLLTGRVRVTNEIRVAAS
jgi:type I restriction enzyme S subunit